MPAGFPIRRPFRGAGPGVDPRGRRSASCGVVTRLRFATLGLLLLVSVTGCDTFYHIVLENNRDEAVRVSVGSQEFEAEPCSVRSHAGGGGQPGRPIRVQAKNDAGKVVYKTEVSFDEKSGFPLFHIRIPSDDPDACPTPADTYTLYVGNHTKEEVEILFDGKLVGSVRANGSARLGPFPGTWQDVGRLALRDRRGERALKPQGVSVNYRLGQVPELGVGIWSPEG